MLSDARLVAFAASRDLDASQQFYVEVLGLELVERSPYGLGLLSNGTELRVNAVADKATLPYTVLGWSVDDLDASVTDLRSSGVAFERYDGLDQDDHDAWTAPDGTRVVWFHDPDANILSLHHHP